MTRQTRVLTAASCCLPILAALGAFRLNNGGDALVTGGTLCLAAGLIAYVFVRRAQLPDGLIAWVIFCLGMTLLLMTALRGWDVTGHDIMREFRVYTLAHEAGRWNIAAYRDAYNACLSITILPAVYSQLLHVSGIVVFKFVLQILFAACPVALYALLRRHLGKLGAIVGCTFFLSYPTFINDAAMLTRQGVAYFFFALALLVVTDAAKGKASVAHKLLFLLTSTGVILAHYSTTYIFVVTLLLAVGCKYGARYFLERCGRRPYRGNPPRTLLTPLFAVAILLGAFMWYAQLTGTSDSLVATVKTSITNIPHLLSDDNKSADTSSALFFAADKSAVEVYESYLNKTRGENQFATAQYVPALTDDIVPPTKIARFLHRWGIEATFLNTWRQQTARFLQILAFGGVVYAAYLLVRRRPQALPPDFVCLAIGLICLLVLMVVLPTLSLNYGMLRAFHQTMLLLLLPMMLLLEFVTRYLRPQLRTFWATTVMAGLFLLFTGVFAQIIGGVSATLTLNNRGLYYGLYYTTKADIRGFAWLKQHIHDKRTVRAAGYMQALMHDPHYPFTIVGVLPSQVQPGDYVYLTEPQMLRQRFYAHYDGSSLITTFPLQYYNERTAKVYSTAATGVYR